VSSPAADRAAAYGLPAVIVDGNDADAVLEVASAALDNARNGGGPSLIEALTYRHGGHSRADPAKYRSEDEVSSWLARDPIPMYRERLLGLMIEESVLDGIEAEARAAVDAATEEAKASPPAEVGQVETEVWADGGSSWRR
jgi:acetoin:2,6-dichlorophenolindophenol oxidoreductase subunit alpha